MRIRCKAEKTRARCGLLQRAAAIVLRDRGLLFVELPGVGVIVGASTDAVYLCGYRVTHDA